VDDCGRRSKGVGGGGGREKPKTDLESEGTEHTARVGRTDPRVVAVDESPLGDPRPGDFAPELVDAPAAVVGRRSALEPLELPGAVVAARHVLGRTSGPGPASRGQGELLATGQFPGDAALAAGGGTAALERRLALKVGVAGCRPGRTDVLLVVSRAATDGLDYRVARRRP
jgi:hypothetical protein